MVSAIRVFLLLALVLSSANYGFSLYEDQVGLMDWHHQYIGKVNDAVFHTQKTGRKRVVVSTEENVIASLDLRHGEILWRHVLGNNDVIDGIEIALGKYVITLSSKGSVLRAWNLPDGQMVWESFLQGLKPSKTLLLVLKNLKVDKENVILVFGKGCLHAVSSFDGELLWKMDFPEESVEVQSIFQPLDSEVIYAVAFVGRSEFNVYQINAKSGELLKHKAASLSGGFSGEVLSVSNDFLVTLDATKSHIVTISIGDGEISLQRKSITTLVGEYHGTAFILPSKLGEIFAVKTSTGTTLIKATSDGKLEVIETINGPAAVSDVLTFSEGQQAVALVQHEDSNIHLTVKLVHEWNSDSLKERIVIDQQRGLVHKVFINNYIRTDKSHGFRALIVMEDHSLLLLQQAEIVWSREDGLASIVDVTTSELPVEKKAVSMAKVENNLLDWLKIPLF